SAAGPGCHASWRDAGFETVDIAIKAALTGHLVFSTVHTNDSASTVTRLENMNIEPFLISDSVVLIIAQRLVRKLCKKCRVKHNLTPAALVDIGFTEKEALAKTSSSSSKELYNTIASRFKSSILALDRSINFFISKEG
ncbi:unnamed protein product, partial [marine sediment metagenome]